MERRSYKRITLALISAGLVVPLLHGCSDGLEDQAVYESMAPVKRDLYHSLEDCLADWELERLCKDVNSLAKDDPNIPATVDLAEYNSQTVPPGGSSGRIVVLNHWYGPQYDPGTRAVEVDKRIIQPQLSRAITRVEMPPTPELAQARLVQIDALRAAGKYTPRPSAVEAGARVFAAHSSTYASSTRASAFGGRVASAVGRGGGFGAHGMAAGHAGMGG